MFTGMELSRISRAVVQGKPACLQPAVVAPSHARFGKRVIRCREQPFRGTNTAQVKAAAAESDAPPPATPAAGGRGRRQRAEPTVDIATIKPGAVLEGTVRSVESFGAFVDIGAASDGLVHISQLTEGFVKSAQDVVKVGQAVKVKVLSVDANSGKMAFTMKGMGMRPAGAAPGRGRYNRDAEEEPVEEEDSSIEPYDVLLESGLLFRDQALYVGDEAKTPALDEGYDPEGADYEFADDPLVSLSGELVTGTVKAVDAGGLTVEFEHGGQTLTGFLPTDELMVPAAAAEAAAEAAGDKLAVMDDGDEAEFMFEAYEDVGGVDDPAQYYKVGDSISAFAEVNPEDRSITLSHFNPLDADDMLAINEVDGEVEEVEDEAALLLDRLEAEGSAGDAEPAAVDADAEVSALDSRTLTAGLYYEQSRTYSTSAAQSFLDGKTPLAFPQRPMRPQCDSALRVPQSVAALTEEDGDEASELIDFWSEDSTNKLPKGALKKLGYKIVKNEESGEWEAVKRDDAPDLSSMELYDMLNMVDDRAVESIVDDILAEDDEEEEAELPFLAMRRPGSIVAAMAVGPIIAAAAAEAAISAADVKALRTKTGAGMMDCKKALKECGGDAEKASEWLRQKGLSGADKKAGRVAAEGAVVRYIHPGNRLGVLIEVNCETDFVAKGDAFNRLANELAMVAASCDAVCVSIEEVPAEILAKEREVEMGKEDLKSKPEAVRAKIVEGRLEKIKRNYALLEQPALRDNSKSVAEIVKETIAATGENIQVRRFVKYNLGEGLEKKSNDFAAEVAQQTQAKAAAPAPKKEEKKEEKKAEEPKKAAVAVSAAQVKQLRDKSGAGMMDCKKALGECGGDMEAASEWLRKKGLASADKKSGRLAAEGGVLGYIHPGSRLGVLLEVNCETDFVARSEPFLALVNTLAMQIAASPSMEYVTADEIPAEVFEAEKAIEMGREDLQSKPEAIRAKIAEGRVKKLVQERVLLDQPYLMDQNKTVGETIKEAVAAIGENIQVRRFSRFVLGEGIEKKVTDLAAEVAAATGGKA